MVSEIPLVLGNLFMPNLCVPMDRKVASLGQGEGSRPQPHNFQVKHLIYGPKYYAVE